MIIRLTVENFLSFNDKVDFLLTPSKVRSLKHHVIRGKKSRDLDILKSAIIYGANASGKSNLVKALSFLKNLVTRGVGGSKFIDYSKFKLDKDSKSRKSQVELEFHFLGVNYAYGVVFDHECIYEEWLYSFNKEKDYKIFERKTVDGEVEISFGDLKITNEEKKRLEYIAFDTLPTELFLHASNHRNISSIAGISPITDSYKWFTDILTIIYPSSKFAGIEINIDSNNELKEVFQWFLSEFQTGISGLETIKVDFFNSEVNIPQKVKNEVVENLDVGEVSVISSFDDIRYSILRREDGEIEAYKLVTKHTIRNSNEVTFFDINEESDGTQRLMDLIPVIMELSKEDKVFVIDEINRSLHPKLTYKLYELFFNESIGIKSQLISTTHESELLNQKLFRKDEIWFVDKNRYGESSVYSLEEFRPRKDKDIRTGYLKGRFDAIPNLVNVQSVPWKITK